MFAKQESLIELVKSMIKDYQKRIEQIMEQNSSLFDKYHKMDELLNDNIENIADISLDEVNSLIQEMELSNEEKDLEFNFLKSIKKLLELNRTKGTTFQLSTNQRDFLNRFKAQFDKKIEEIKEEEKEELKKASSMTDNLKSLKKLLGVLEDSKNKDYIRQVDILDELLDRMSIDPIDQRKMLLGILRYNESIYSDKFNSKEEVVRERLNIEELKDLLSSFGYDLDKFNEKQQENLLNYGNLDRIKEVLESLDKYFPKFDLKRNGNKLVVLLINGDSNTIKEIVEYSSVKGITPQDLLMITAAMIKQKNKKKMVKDGGESIDTPFITGKSEDYKKNVEFLEDIGFNIRYIYNKCKELLIMSNEKLVSNYHKFVVYGFTISTDEYGDLYHPALSCLLSSNFEEIVDQFIEICRDGHQYIKENMSRIMTTSSPKDIMFYNIYASYMTQDDMGNYQFAEGPFATQNYKKLKLRGEITRYAGSGYEKINYRGITDDNKQEKTMTIKIECTNQEEFDKAVEDAKGRDEELYNLVYNDPIILELEEKTDASDPARYDFNGILISKQKVKRIYNILKNNHLENLDDSLLYAITYNSIMSQETFDSLKEMLKARRK